MQKGNYLCVFSQHNVQTMHAVTEKTALNKSTTSPVCVKQVFLGRGVNQVRTKRFLIQFVQFNNRYDNKILYLLHAL